MSYTAESIDNIIARAKTDIQTVTSQGIPNEKNNLLFALVVALANLKNDLNKELELNVIPNLFPNTAQTLDELQKFSSLWNVPQNPAVGSSGFVTFTGNVGSVIPANATLSANGNQYINLSDVAIQADSINIISLSRSGTTVTAVCSSDIPFASGNNVNITGASDDSYNGTQNITVTALNTFQYQVLNASTNSPTGTISASCNCGVAEIRSIEVGLKTNLSNGDIIGLNDSIAGINSAGNVQYSGITGGDDTELFTNWQSRIVERIANPITRFNENNIRATAEKVTGVTKVWVYALTPAIGQCTVYFIRGNDVNIIPDSNEIADVKNALAGLLDVNDDIEDLYVLAPTAVSIPITFSAITPNTMAMKTAITNVLNEFFKENLEIGVNVKLDKIKSAIWGAVDLANGKVLNDFTLTAPTADVTISTGQLGTLGAITFN